MSGTEEKGNNNDEETAASEDLVNINTEIRSESGVPDIPSGIASEDIGAISKVPSYDTEGSIDKESGDTKVEKENEYFVNIDKKFQEPVTLDFGKGSGDHTAVSQTDSSTMDKETSFIYKKDEITLMNVSADTTDADEMELKWDDGDEDDDDKSAVKESILLEDQLLQDDTSNSEISKSDIKDTRLIDENILEEINANEEITKDKSETDKMIDNKEGDKLNSPMQETENNKETFNIDTPVLETKTNEEIAEIDTADSPIKENTHEKIAEVTPKSSGTAVKDIQQVVKVEKGHKEEVIDIKETQEDANTGVKPNNAKDKDTEIIRDGDLNKGNDDLLLETVDSPTHKTPEPELDVPMDDALNDENNKNRDHLLQEIVDSPVTNKIPDLEVDESMDNIDDVTEDELLKDDEKQVISDDGPSVNVEDKIVKDDENQLIEDDGPSVDDLDKTIEDDENQVIEKDGPSVDDQDKIIEDDENQVIEKDGPSIDDQDKIVEELLKDDEKQVIDDDNQDKSDQVHKDDENQVMNEDGQDKISEDLFKDFVNQVGKDDNDKDNVDEQLPKDVENQVMNMCDAVQDKVSNNTDKKSTDLHVPKPSVEDQNKMDDNMDHIPSALNKEVREKEDQTPSKCLDTMQSDESENIALEKVEKEIVSEIKPTEKIVEKSDPKLVDDEPTELSTRDLTEESEIDEKVKEITNVSSMGLNNTQAEEKPDISNTNTKVQKEESNKNTTLENDSKSNVICLDDSPVHIKKPHSLHKPDVMLEIPTQELIDIDAELSINLDQSVPASPEMIDKSEDIAKEMVDENITDIVERLDNKDNLIKDTVIQESVEEGMERMFAEEPVVNETNCIATTSQPESNLMVSDSNDLPEMTDSLGLLAESVLVRDDEGDAVDDDDFDQYESSNQVSPDQSDDSNTPQSETDAARDQQEKEFDSPDVKENEFQFTISNVESTMQEKEKTGEILNAESEVEGATEEDTKASEDALLKNDEEFIEEQNEESLDQDQQVDIDTVKLSDTSDSEEKDQTAKLTQCEMKERDEKTPEREVKSASRKSTPSQSSPSKMKKLEIKTLEPNQIVNIVDLQESSSSEDESRHETEREDLSVSLPPSPDNSVTNVNIPSGIEVMASGGTTSELVSKRGELVVSGVPRPKPHPPARLNTSEVSIKTVSHTEPMVIPETKISQLPPETQVKPKLGLEIFSLDSDEEENVAKELPQSPIKSEVPEKRRKVIKCINYSCTSGSKVPFILADARITAFYESGRKRRTMVCQNCADAVYSRAQNLIQGIKNFTPLLDLQMSNQSHELVEISDSESEDDDDEMVPEPPKESIGEKAAKFLEENLADIFNATWKTYDLETRLKETQIMLEDEIDQLERETKDLDQVFNDYQEVTDKLRRELYATFQVQREELPALTIVDKPGLKFVGREAPLVAEAVVRADKRRKSTVNVLPAKRPAIPLGYAPLDDVPKDKLVSTEIKLEEDKDISVVRLSMELAPADLPPPGTISRPPLRVGMPVYAMKNAFGPWLKGRILEIQPRVANTPNIFSLCRVKFDHKTKTNAKILPARCVAYAEPSDVRMTIGTRLIALFKDSNRRESYYSGVVAEIPNPVNSYRYLVFFDDGYAQYVHHPFTRLVCESSPLVWEEVHPFSRDFVMEYLLKYPERPMVRLHEGQHLKTEWNGKWWPSRVSRVDASLAQVMFVGDGRREWVYRGSTRLAPLYLALRAAERHRPRPQTRTKAQPGSNMPYVEYTRSDEPEASKQPECQIELQTEEIRHQRAVAKKSTASHIPPPPQDVPKINANDTQTKESRVVYYTPKNAVRPYKMSPHRCGPQCKRSDVLTLKELRTYNPLAKPLLSGWERQLVRFKGNKEVMYRAPCGRRLRNMGELHHYLRLIDCELPVDLFDFNPMTHCLAEFVMHKCLVGKKDLSHGKENVPVPCVNFFDESLPEFCSYNTERTPTAGVPLNLDPEFLCGCDCTDDCADKEKCACWRMTLEGARTIGLEGPSVGYVYKRLPEPLPSGIYECNSRCKCRDTCLNRVAQHPLQLKLQVFKTENRGWGIRALNDVPKGSFLCVYAGNLLTDATANLDGLNEGDEYLAELDYIEVVEQMKEGYEEDIPEADKKLDKKEQKNEDDDDDEESESSSSEDDDTASKTDKEDDDFRPGHIGLGVTEFNKRLRRRSSKKVKEESSEDKEASAEKKESNAEDDCITISDDEEVREPSSFTVKAGMGANDFVSKYRSVRTYFGADEACYIMDAKVQGNIGRYLNHSCCPNVFVQNVFVDTHDPRFPWVAFFALSHIKAGSELTWNYNYDVGSVPGKVLYCFCGAPNCRGRLL